MAEEKLVRILYMEDDPGLARLFQKKLRRAGYAVDIAHNGEEGLEMYYSGSYDVIATDQAMPIHSGLDVIRILASQGDREPPPTIMVTGTGSEQIAVEAMKLGASDYIVKDVDGGYLDLLPAVVERVLQQQRLIEEKRRAEESLRQYAAELEARNEELDAFAHTVAHDLKGPLSYIVGFAKVLTEDYIALSDDEMHRYLQNLARQGQKMSRIIDELLLLFSVRKMSDVEIRPVDMSSVFAEVQERLDYLIKEHQAEIILPDTWPLALGYGPWIEEIWANYLSNAIKYGGTPPRITLGADTWAATDAKTTTPQIRFWIRDNGAGITPEEQERLFTPFTRLDQVRAKGHGLGLSIVRRIVGKLDGQVGVESDASDGSTFWFTLPAHPHNTEGVSDERMETP